MKAYLILRENRTAKVLTDNRYGDCQWEFDVQAEVNLNTTHGWVEKRIKLRVEEDNMTPGLYPMTINKNGVKIYREVKDAMALIEKLSNANYDKNGLASRPGIKGCDNGHITRESAQMREAGAHRLAELLKDSI